MNKIKPLVKVFSRNAGQGESTSATDKTTLNLYVGRVIVEDSGFFRIKSIFNVNRILTSAL